MSNRNLPKSRVWTLCLCLGTGFANIPGCSSTYLLAEFIVLSLFACRSGEICQWSAAFKRWALNDRHQKWICLCFFYQEGDSIYRKISAVAVLFRIVCLVLFSWHFTFGLKFNVLLFCFLKSFYLLKKRYLFLQLQLQITSTYVFLASVILISLKILANSTIVRFCNWNYSKSVEQWLSSCVLLEPKYFVSKLMCFLGSLSYIQCLQDYLKSPIRRGRINCLDRLPVIQEMAALKLDLKSQFWSMHVFYASVLKWCGPAI